jgi:hypothetical protein
MKNTSVHIHINLNSFKSLLAKISMTTLHLSKFFALVLFFSSYQNKSVHTVDSHVFFSQVRSGLDSHFSTRGTVRANSGTLSV